MNSIHSYCGLPDLKIACAAVGVAIAFGLICAAPAQSALAAQDSAIPKLLRSHGATQIVIGGKPFLVRGGELENSSASSLTYMDQKVWPKAVSMHFNTVLAPVYWQLIEPREGTFDFSTVDGLIRGARQHNIRLVLLWFGTWKNSMSCYVPSWVNRDENRFPRAAQVDGKTLDILSALSANNLNADASAFAALLRHLRATDSTARTVIMMQVENEVGMIPEARDHSAAANAAFDSPVPAALTDYLTKNKDSLAPALRKAWEDHGAKTGANWAETFGEGVQTDELFTAWTEARYTGEVAARGKAVYPLPMYVNAALIRPGKQPGSIRAGDRCRICSTSGGRRRRTSTISRRISTFRISWNGRGNTRCPTILCSFLKAAGRPRRTWAPMLCIPMRCSTRWASTCTRRSFWRRTKKRRWETRMT